jgi:hypothetical protein
LRVYAANSRRFPECFNLGSRLNTPVGHDLLKHAQARFDALNVRRVLRGLLGSLISNQLAHLFFVLKPSIEHCHAEAAQRWDCHHDNEEDQQ